MEDERLSVRKIVIAGVLSAITILLGSTRLGFIPVPTPAANATIMHVPAIVGGILEGWVVGGIVGTIFGIFSFIQAEVPMFKDPLVAILPRIFIGPAAYLAYRLVRRLTAPWMLLFAALLLGLAALFAYDVGRTNLWLAGLVVVLALAGVGVLVYLILKGQSDVVAVAVAAAFGTITNTGLVLGMGVLRGYMAPGVAWVVAVTHGVPEIIVAAIITVAVVVTWRRVETGRGEARM